MAGVGDADSATAAVSDMAAVDTATDAADTHLALVAPMRDAELTAVRLAVMRVARLEAQPRRHAVDSAVAAEPVAVSAAAATRVVVADTGNR